MPRTSDMYSSIHPFDNKWQVRTSTNKTVHGKATTCSSGQHWRAHVHASVPFTAQRVSPNAMTIHHRIGVIRNIIFIMSIISIVIMSKIHNTDTATPCSHRFNAGSVHRLLIPVAHSLSAVHCSPLH